MPTMGEVLRDARYRRNVSLEEVECDTRIRKKYLLALEEDDYAQLPAPVYARGFLDTYAEYLGLDPGLVAKLYQPPARSAVPEAIRPAASGYYYPRGISLSSLLPVVLFALGMVALFFLYRQYLEFASNPGEVVTTRPVAMATATLSPVAVVVVAPTSTPTPLPSPSATPVRSVEVLVTVSERSWMRVVADGQNPPLFEGELQAGESRTWKARDRIDMRVGNAGGVEATVNGMKQGKLGARGEVKNVTWGRQ